jgi:hypothetical protein
MRDGGVNYENWWSVFYSQNFVFLMLGLLSIVLLLFVIWLVEDRGQNGRKYFMEHCFERGGRSTKDVLGGGEINFIKGWGSFL